MPRPEELAAVADRLGVSTAQVRRDQLISHLLGLLSRELADQVLTVAEGAAVGIAYGADVGRC
jgi:hypothetical protein